MSVVSINGTIKCSFEFINLPTRNTTYKNHFEKGRKVKDLRHEAYRLARDWRKDALGWRNMAQPLITRGFVMVNAYCQHEGIMDVHNLDIKPVMDGLVDAHIFVDDEWAFIPLVSYRWAGIDAGKQRRTVLDVYELEALIINDEAQILPLGRRSI